MAIKANDTTKRQRVVEILKTFDLDSSAVWDCHGTPVIYHWACERIASKMKLVFDAPVIIDQDTVNKMITILVTGRSGEVSEWSFGEVSGKNCQNSYPWSMAEKRGKDRVILKFAGLSGQVYSEEEADDFKPGRGGPANDPKPRGTVQTTDQLDWDDVITNKTSRQDRKNAAKSREPYALIKATLDMAVVPEDLPEWASANADEIYMLADEARHHLRDAYNGKYEDLLADRSAA